MKNLLLASAVLLATTAAGGAATIADLGFDPTSSTGKFESLAGGVNGTGLGPFQDWFPFELTKTLSITIASATNVFPGGDTTTDFITNFSASVFSAGADGFRFTADDQLVLGPDFATLGCAGICQNLFGVAALGPDKYYLELSGTGGGTSGYGGNLAAVAVPGPLAGAGLPGLLAGIVGLWGLARRRRKHNGLVA